MVSRHIKFAILASALLLGACAGVAPRGYLPDAARDKIASTEVVLPIRQHEIYVYVPPSNSGAAAGGLLGALIDTSINSIRNDKAEDAVKPLRDAIVDYDFDSTLKDAMKSTLSQVPALHAQDYRVIKEVSDPVLDDALIGSKDAAVLFAFADYRLSNEGSDLSVIITATLFANSDALRAVAAISPSGKVKREQSNALYRNTFTFEAALPNASGNRDQDIQSWSANNGALMRADLAMAAQKLSQLVAQDVMATPASETAGGTVEENGVKLTLVSSDNDGHLMRAKDGTLKYVKQ